MERGSSLAVCSREVPFSSGFRRICTSNISGAIRDGSGERHFERYFERWQSERPGKERPAPGPAPSEEMSFYKLNENQWKTFIIWKPNLCRYLE